MRANLAGRVRNTTLPKTHPLLPLFEAVVNSIDAIEEAAPSPEQGIIQITIQRQPTLALKPDAEGEDRSHTPIRGFVIRDNGIGFTEGNFQAFNESDTQVKASKGGKGVGRFIWLKAFERVRVESAFRSDAHLWQRTFIFSLDAVEGVYDHDLSPVEEPAPLQTTVSLIDFKEEYERLCPRSAHTIARHLLEHFLEYYVMTKMPLVTIVDEAEDEPIHLDAMFDGLVSATTHNTIAVDGHQFDIGHFFLRSARGLSHRISYCANGRAVIEERIGNKSAQPSEQLALR